MIILHLYYTYDDDDDDDNIAGLFFWKTWFRVYCSLRHLSAEMNWSQFK